MSVSFTVLGSLWAGPHLSQPCMLYSSQDNVFSSIYQVFKYIYCIELFVHYSDIIQNFVLRLLENNQILEDNIIFQQTDNTFWKNYLTGEILLVGIIKKKCEVFINVQWSTGGNKEWNLQGFYKNSRRFIRSHSVLSAERGYDFFQKWQACYLPDTL